MPTTVLHCIAPGSAHTCIAEYKAWCTNHIQLDRPGRACSSSTWENSEKHIFLYLEYCHHYHQVSVPTMQLFLSTPLICHYVSFHIAAEHSHLTIRNFLNCAKRVLRWWQIKPGGKHPSLVEGLLWLQTWSVHVMLLLFCVSSFVVLQVLTCVRACVRACVCVCVAYYVAVAHLIVCIIPEAAVTVIRLTV